MKKLLLIAFLVISSVSVLYISKALNKPEAKRATLRPDDANEKEDSIFAPDASSVE